MRSKILFISAALGAVIAAATARAVVASKDDRGPGIEAVETAEASEAAVEASSAGEGGESLEAFTARRLGLEFRTQALTEQGRWGEALALAEELLALDPINEVGAASLQRVEREESARTLLEDALHLLREEGREEAALERFLTVPDGTESHGRARIEVERLLPAVAKRARSDCLGLHKNGRYREAWERCSFYLDWTCGQEEEPAVVERLRWLEKKLGSPRWTCPERILGWLGTAPAGARAAGGDGRLREILERWAAGESGELAVTQVSRLADEGLVEARQLLPSLEVADRRLREGIASLLGGRLEEAEEKLQQAKLAEQALLPRGRSIRLREALRDLGRRWLEEGRVLEAKRRWPEAAEALRRGMEADPESMELRRARWRIERRVDDPLAVGR